MRQIGHYQYDIRHVYLAWSGHGGDLTDRSALPVLVTLYGKGVGEAGLLQLPYRELKLGRQWHGLMRLFYCYRLLTRTGYVRIFRCSI